MYIGRGWREHGGGGGGGGLGGGRGERGESLSVSACNSIYDISIHLSFSTRKRHI